MQRIKKKIREWLGLDELEEYVLEVQRFTFKEKISMGCHIRHLEDTIKRLDSYMELYEEFRESDRKWKRGVDGLLKSPFPKSSTPPDFL